MQTFNPSYILDFRFSAMPLGVVVTAVLFVLMAKLISHDMEEQEIIVNPPINPPIHTEEPIENRYEKKVEKPKVETPPELPPSNIDNDHESDITYANFEPVDIKSDGAGIRISGMPIAQYQVAAQYPQKAITRNIEGFVDVKFDITVLGTTENISVVRAVPESIFDRSAVNAVKRWRYRPKMEEGQAVAYPGMVQRITFVLEN